MRPRCVLPVLAGLVAGALIPVPAFADGVAVVPGDAQGYYGSPSIGLGAAVGGTPARQGSSGSRQSSGEDPGAGSGVPGPPPGLSWSAPNGAPSWFTAAPEFRFPDFSEPTAPSPGQLAAQAVGQLHLPLPVPRHSPDLHLPDGRAATLVGEHTWFWTEPSQWRSVHRRIQAGPAWVEVTATPQTLSLYPGTSQDPVSCPGPGTPYDRSFGLHTASPDCDIVFERSSIGQPGEQVQARWAITWDVSWRGFDGTGPTGGTLPPMTSRTGMDLAVAEAQALTTD